MSFNPMTGYVTEEQHPYCFGFFLCPQGGICEWVAECTAISFKEWGDDFD